MSSNISDPLPKKYDNTSEDIRKTSRDQDETKKKLVTTTDTVFKEGNTDIGTKTNVVKEAISIPMAKKNIDTVNKKEKPQASNKTVDTPNIN